MMKAVRLLIRAGYTLLWKVWDVATVRGGAKLLGALKVG
jgi:hypothetical protein